MSVKMRLTDDGFTLPSVIQKRMDEKEKKMTPHLDYEFPESTEQTDDALAEQVREVINVLNSLVLRLQEREISIKLSPVMNHFDKTAYYVVEIHKHL